MLGVLLACSPHVAGNDGDAAFTVEETTTPPWTGPSDIVPFAEQEILLTVDEPYEFLWASATFGDLDGDRIADLLVEIWVPHEDFTGSVTQWIQVVVRGPLQAGTNVPIDAWIELDATAVYVWPAELTGDDALDLVVQFDPYAGGENWIAPSPFDGDTAIRESWISFDPTWWPSWWWDADQDGTQDLVHETAWDHPDESDALEITWGPVERWDGPPDVTVSPLCEGGYAYGYPLSRFAFPGDLDGAGDPEMVFGSYGWAYGNADCGGFLLSLPESGSIDPFHSPLGTFGLDWSYMSAGDWTGDGLPEVKDGDDLLLSPITLSADGWVAEGGTIEVDVWDSYALLDFDLGNDGVPDAMGIVGNTFVVFPATLDDLTHPIVDRGWEIGVSAFSVYTFLDRDHGWLAQVDIETSTIRRVDLGPASPR